MYSTVFELESRHWWFRGRRAVIDSLLARLPVDESRSILDAGCGTGRNLEEYARLGIAAGIDPSPEAVRFCQERGLSGVEVGTLERLPFADSAFDLSCSTDVLEHVEDDEAALIELHRVTKPGGHLLMTVPAFMWLWSESDETLHHQRRYTRGDLVRRLQSTGWSPEFATYFNSFLLPAIWLARRVRRGRNRELPELARTSSVFDAPLSWPMRFEARLIRAGVRFPVGVSIGVIARRT